MSADPRSRSDYAIAAVSVVLGAVFIYAGVDKIRDPLQFADSIAAFAIVPAVFINFLAIGLPPFEVMSGLLVLAPATRRIGALAVVLCSAIFFCALLSALLRGLTLDCGCFGAGAPSRPRMWLELGVDAMLFSGALLVYSRSLEGSLRRAI